MKSSTLWDTWLQSVGWILVVFGLALGFFNQTTVFDLAFNRQVDPVFWPDGMPDSSVESFQSWVYGVLGFTVSGWGVFVAFLARYPFRERASWARNCIFVGITLWYVTDTAISLYFGVLFNAVFNTLLAFLVYLPLAATWSQFREG